MASQKDEYETVPVVEIEENDTKTKEEPSYGYGVRHVQSLIIWMVFLTGYVARAHLGVSVVEMTYNPKLYQPTDVAKNVFLHSDKSLNNTNIRNESKIPKETDMNIAKPENPNENCTANGVINLENSSVADEYGDNNIGLLFDDIENITSDANGIYKKYPWTKPIQEMLLTSFFWGYCVTQYFMSMIAQRWGGKLPLQIGLFINAVVSIATPWLAFWGGWKAVCACRIMQGLSQGGFLPSIQTLLAQWIPPSERARHCGFVCTGIELGTIAAFQLGGFLAGSRWGWPSIFWGTGILCLIAFTVLTVFGAATPAEHKTISEEEVKFITYTMTNVSKKKPQVPLKAILTSKHVWATFSTHIGSSIAFLFIFMQVPSYLHYSLGVNVKNSGLFSSTPYIASFCSSIFYGVLSDFLTNRKYMTVKTARRAFNTFSQISTALCLVAVSYTKSVGLAVTLLVVAQTVNVAYHVGWMVNYIDLSSNFSGVLHALGNTLMHAFTMILPIIVSNVITDVTNQTQWRIMFYLMAAVALVTNTFFVVFMSADKQPWDDVEYDNDSDEIRERRKKEKESPCSTELLSNQ